MSTRSSREYCNYTINAVTDRTCPNCGAPVPPQTELPQTVEEPPLQESPLNEPLAPSWTDAKRVISAIFFFIILFIAIASFAPFYNSFRTTTLPVGNGSVFITDAFLHIQYPSSSDNYLGPLDRSIGEGVSWGRTPFYVSYGIPFPLTVNITMTGLEPHIVESFSVSTQGFSLDRVNPATPHTMNPGSSLSFSVWVYVPAHEYKGPVMIVLSTY